MEKVIILGSGPAGLTAAIYAARAELKPLVIAGLKPGGQLMITSEVENFPGFPEGVMGPDLMEKMRKQATKFGARFIDKDASEVLLKKAPYKIKVGSDEFETESLIIATGASSLWLNLPSEQKLIGHGVSSCATCDGFFFRNKKVVVAGGGDSAMEEALFLTKFASEVTVIHRRGELRASKIMQERAFANPKIKFIWNTDIKEVLGDKKVTGLKVSNNQTNDISEVQTDGLFVAIGHAPNTAIFKGKLDLDEKGYLVVRDQVMTDIKGVFVSGDVLDHRYRQAITAAGWGCMAAMEAEKFIREKQEMGKKK